ncbi:Gfo/Idh/MocA family oxidoreductase [Amycolatopsis sp. K13G38]|uniref:Gfo/Idh/MocA family oxidoreductase n=1 Tax=Amycolatopsis acididurans TaxID=2724524 RepID=A0ABX1J5E4_9PSEU|nr:Gfo/Idh/MocA family oxidoreductase [Amycolatopsis acididurans]NKQ55023.1 Gfo/Idh/MocA family oxidoreductase [Amycolatopsis acididurans]
MRVGIAGTGRIGAGHAMVLAAHDDVTELVVFDEDRDRASAVAAKANGVVAASLNELFDANLDGLVISTATSAHAELIEAAVKAGVPAFCEKPVAIDAERTKQVLELVSANDVPVQVGFQRRFDKGYAAGREALRNGELGDLRRLHLISGDPAPPPESFIVTSGGIARDLHIHDFDILRWVTGREVVEVYSIGANRGADYFAKAHDPDESVGTLLLDDGTLVTFQGSRYNGAGYDIRMEIIGTEANHVVGLTDRTPIRSAEPGVEFPAGPAWTLFWDRFEPAYAEELRTFIDVAAGRCENPCTVEDALQASYIAEAVELSRREHRPVRIQEVAAL